MKRDADPAYTIVEPLELLRLAAEGEYTPEVRSWFTAAAKGMFRDVGAARIAFDRRLRLPRPKGQPRALRDFWLRRAYTFCDGPSTRVRIGRLLAEVGAVQRIAEHISPAGPIREEAESEFRRAVLYALRQGEPIPVLRQLYNILGVQ